MKTILCLLLLFFGLNETNAQVSVDYSKLMKMSPAELEAYKKKMIQQASKQAETLIQTHNLEVNTELLPTYEVKPPVKDIQRLSLIPLQPPTRQQLVTQVQQSMTQVQQGIPAPRIAEINRFTSNIPVSTIHETAIAGFYNNNPKEAIYLMMKAAAEAPDSLLLLNNLGAMLNLVNVQEKAIPLFQYCLAKNPYSSIVLNNIGQSFMALGELMKAADYFNQCLSIDSLNIEANHSMGMLHVFKKEYETSMKYFNREMSMAMRRSTMAQAYRMGKKFDLRGLARQKNQRSGRPQKDFLEEITLGKFAFPTLPITAREVLERKPEFTEYAGSVQTEAAIWRDRAGQVLRSYKASDGDKHPGLYSELVKAMLEELDEEFTPKYLIPFSDYDAHLAKKIVEDASKALISVKCKKAPAGSGFAEQRAFEIRCCEDSLRPIADKMMMDLSGHLNPIINMGQQRYKSYINQLVAIVQLDPSISNQALVYNAVSGYFTFLSWGCLFFNGEINNLLPGCVDKYDPATLDSLVQSERAWKVDCPSFLNFEMDLGGAVVKADCNKYVVEAGEFLLGAFEHEFKSGNSTLLLGPGVKGDLFGGLIKAETKSQLYLTFDKNKEFADMGLRNTSEIGVSGTPLPFKGVKIGGNLGGVELSDSYGIISGHQQTTEWKGGLNWLMQKGK